MNNGGKDRRKGNHGDSDQDKKYRNEEFARAIVNVAVSQICRSQGFQAVQQSALEALSGVAIQHMIDVGKRAASSANSAGRTEVNTLDIIHGLEDLGLVVGFSGASNVDHCIAHSGTVKEVLQYVDDAEEIAFAFPLPPIPISKERKRELSFLQAGEEPPYQHIPPWLPKFPDPQSYDKKDSVKSLDPISGDEKEKKVEYPQTNMHQVSSYGWSSEVKEAGETNPFLRVPLYFGEKDVSPAALPPNLSDDGFQGNNGVLETFAPAIEAVGGTGGSEGQKVPGNKSRPTLQFKIRNSKKGFCMNRELKHPLSIKDGGYNDEKRKRAEEILKESEEKAKNLLL